MNVSPIKIDDNNYIYYPDLDIETYRNINADLYHGAENALRKRIKTINLRAKQNYNIEEVSSYRYNNNLSYCYWYLLHITNPYIYNYYLNEIINIHKTNLYDLSNKVFYKEENTKKRKTDNNTRKSKPKNKYVKHPIRNIITGEVEYEYINYATGDKIISSDDRLLDSLNAKPKRQKKEKKKREARVVNINSMMLDFSKFKRDK